MEIFYQIKNIKEAIQILKKNKKSIGFVPTMGALHNGHSSLIEQSKRQNDVTIVSIFVNPTQFNNKEDLKNYPRPLDLDIEKLKKAGCDVLFNPDNQEMYPEPDNRTFEFGNLDKVMEGYFRPGHFNGVAQIVSKFFEIITPDRAYFGEKDFQQLAIIKYLNKNYLSHLNIEIIGCPIFREPDGLAMSSRNMLLTPEQRENAAVISQTLFWAKENKNITSIKAIKEQVINIINSNPLLEVEYFDIVDAESLVSLSEWKNTHNSYGCIAVYSGKIRLIDNIRL